MDNLDNLERLARLRDQGLLTEDEFAAEKARVLGSLTPSQHWEDGTSDHSAISARGANRWLWPAGLLVVSVAGLVGWQQFESDGQSSARSILSAIPGIAQAQASEWQFSRSSDPMTDDEVLQAGRTIQSDNFQIDALIACRPSEGQVSYSFTTFMRDGKAAPARSFGFLKQLYHHATVRRDRSEPERLELSSTYTNQFVITESAKGFQIAKDEGLRVGYLPTAQHLTVQLALMNGDPVFEIDQTDSVVARVLAACAGSEGAPTATSPPSQMQDDPPRPVAEHATHLFDIGDFSLEGGVGSNPQPGGWADFCVGDTLLIRNQSRQRVTVLGSLSEGDEVIDVNSIEPGETFSYEIQLEGPWFLTVRGHPGAQFTYKADQC